MHSSEFFDMSCAQSSHSEFEPELEQPAVFECIIWIQADQLLLNDNASDLEHAKQTTTGRQPDDSRDATISCAQASA